MHVLIVGMTMSGKTTLAKRLCSAYRRKAIKTVVLDPLLDAGWSADIVTANADKFLEVARLSTSCALFVDESGETIGHYEKQMFWLATRARHYGHKTHFITQRANQLSPTVRDQCSDLFAFAMSHQDCIMLAREFNKDALLECKSLPRLVGYHVNRFEQCELIDMRTEGAENADTISDTADYGGREPANRKGNSRRPEGRQ